MNTTQTHRQTRRIATIAASTMIVAGLTGTVVDNNGEVGRALFFGAAASATLPVRSLALATCRQTAELPLAIPPAMAARRRSSCRSNRTHRRQLRQVHRRRRQWYRQPLLRLRLCHCRCNARRRNNRHRRQLAPARQGNPRSTRDTATRGPPQHLPRLAHPALLIKRHRFGPAGPPSRGGPAGVVVLDYRWRPLLRQPQRIVKGIREHDEDHLH